MNWALAVAICCALIIIFGSALFQKASERRERAQAACAASGEVLIETQIGTYCVQGRRI